MLNYFRETQGVRIATPGRRIYDDASVGVTPVVMALVLAGLVPLWIFWIVFPVCLVLDTLLTKSGSEKMRSEITEPPNGSRRRFLPP